MFRLYHSTRTQLLSASWTELIGLLRRLTRIEDCITHYLHCWNVIHSSGRDGTETHTKSPIVAALKVVECGNALRVGVCLVLTLCPLSQYWRALLWDQMLLEPKLNVIFVIFGLSSGYMHHRLYFSQAGGGGGGLSANKPENQQQRRKRKRPLFSNTTTTTVSLVGKWWPELVVTKKHSNSNNRKSSLSNEVQVEEETNDHKTTQMLLLDNNNKEDLDRVRHWARTSCTMLGWFNLSSALTGVGFILAQCHSLLWAHQPPGFTHWWHSIVLAGNFVTFTLSVYLLSVNFAFHLILCGLFTKVVLARLKRLNQALRAFVLRCSNHKSRRPVLPKAFATGHTASLLAIFEMNRVFGPSLVISLVATVPMSVYLTVMLIARSGGGANPPLNPLVTAIIIVVIETQLAVNFGCHLVAAHYTGAIHHCRRPLMSLCAELARRRHRLPPSQFRPLASWLWADVRQSLRLEHYLVRFQCPRQRYGITYAGYGLVSFRSFFKFTLLYGELLVYCYQLMQSHRV